MATGDPELAARLLELQAEYTKRAELEALAAEFQRGDWAARPEEDIAADYAETLAQFVRGLSPN